MYKNSLESKRILSDNVLSLIEQLKDKTLTNLQYHNKKAYCKRTNNFLGVVELTTAWEIVNMLEKENG